jgi:hypothetical protein
MMIKDHRIHPLHHLGKQRHSIPKVLLAMRQVDLWVTRLPQALRLHSQIHMIATCHLVLIATLHLARVMRLTTRRRLLRFQTTIQLVVIRRLLRFQTTIQLVVIRHLKEVLDSRDLLPTARRLVLHRDFHHPPVLRLGKEDTLVTINSMVADHGNLGCPQESPTWSSQLPVFGVQK